MARKKLSGWKTSVPRINYRLHNTSFSLSFYSTASFLFHFEPMIYHLWPTGAVFKLLTFVEMYQRMK